MKPLNQLLRSTIQTLKPYSSARDEYTGEAAVLLDANENPFNAPYNRYPDPYQRKVKAKIATLKGVDSAQIFLGNGSDEPIDLLFRAFCEPALDNVISIDPTYGMYQVAADINNVEVRRVLLTEAFQLDVPALLKTVDERTKLLFLCSPNNPTGNCLKTADIESVLNGFEGIVVLDEAYIDFAPGQSFLSRLNEFPNLVILQTFSKAWGMAGIRLGMAFADKALINVLSKIKYPYNINVLTQQKALELLASDTQVNYSIEKLLSERELLETELKKLAYVQQVYPSDANFILVKTDCPKEIYNFLVEKKIIIRDRSSVALCDGCLRMTVGSPAENSLLLEALRMFASKK